MSEVLDREKRAAAERAAQAVVDGMVVGLGTGSTAELMIRALAERVRRGLEIVGVPTSERTARLARDLGVPLADLQSVARIDLTIDGADEIDPRTLWVLKGHGGALLHEKLVALASERLMIIADRSKVVGRLGSRHPVPVEIVPFGHRVPETGLIALGGRTALRLLPDGRSPYVTDGGHFILDVDFGPIADPPRLAKRIKALSGVVDHGLFIGPVSVALVAGPDGVAELLPATTGAGPF